MNPLHVMNMVIDGLTLLNVGIKTTKMVVAEFQALYPEYNGLSDLELINIYEMRTSLTREKLKALLEE